MASNCVSQGIYCLKKYYFGILIINFQKMVVNIILYEKLNHILSKHLLYKSVGVEF
jgi:hypothetical protein